MIVCVLVHDLFSNVLSEYVDRWFVGRLLSPSKVSGFNCLEENYAK